MMTYDKRGERNGLEKIEPRLDEEKAEKRKQRKRGIERQRERKRQRDRERQREKRLGDQLTTRLKIDDVRPLNSFFYIFNTILFFLSFSAISENSAITYPPVN